MGLADNPVSIARECPAGDGANQSLPVRERGDEERDQLGEVGQHSIHTAL